MHAGNDPDRRRLRPSRDPDVSPSRDDRVTVPPPDGQWDVRFGTSDAVVGWEELCRHALANTRRCLETLRTDPRSGAGHDRQHRGTPKTQTASALDRHLHRSRTDRLRRRPRSACRPSPQSDKHTDGQEQTVPNLSKPSTLLRRESGERGMFTPDSPARVRSPGPGIPLISPPPIVLAGAQTGNPDDH